MSKTALKACPWCGEQPHLVAAYANDGLMQYAYFCDDNGKKESHYVETAWHDTEENAQNAWNKRYDVDDERIEKRN